MQLDEGRAELMADLIRTVLYAAELALTEAQRQLGLKLAAGQLRTLAAGD